MLQVFGRLEVSEATLSPTRIGLGRQRYPIGYAISKSNLMLLHAARLRDHELALAVVALNFHSVRRTPPCLCSRFILRLGAGVAHTSADDNARLFEFALVGHVRLKPSAQHGAMKPGALLTKKIIKGDLVRVGVARVAEERGHATRSAP